MVVMVSRWVAGIFVGGVFTNYNRYCTQSLMGISFPPLLTAATVSSILKLPILEWTPPHDMYTLQAKDVMNKPPVTFFLTERVGDVCQVFYPLNQS